MKGKIIKFPISKLPTKKEGANKMEKANWLTVERPGWFGEAKENILQNFDKQYGAGNWRIRHQLGPRLLDFREALRIYELCYEMHFLDPHTRYLWTNLFKIAKNIWTEQPSDTGSGTNYYMQNAKAPHYEDIAIRIIMEKYQKRFEGEKLIRIRADSKDVVGIALSSIHIPFIFPKFIEPSFPETLWWNRHEGSLEHFWHCNKVLQIKSA